jgi:tRNA(adenine34) deaminase
MLHIYDDTYFMKQAYQEALTAYEKGEVPVGAVITCKSKIIARGHNQTELLSDVTAHAEIIAITAAAAFLDNKYLNDCTIYITLEPCIMCAGALYWSQIDRVVFAAQDDKRGFMRHGKELLHPRTKLEYGIMMDECSQLMKDFFSERR